jgi:hypothetical protein
MSNIETREQKEIRWEQERVALAARKKFNKNPNVYGRMMKPGANYEPGKGTSRNRKSTPGKRHVFIQAVKRISSPGMAMARKVIRINSFKKHMIKKVLKQ